jgi:hypothetical protein
MVRIVSGSVSFKAANFHPDADLFFGCYNMHNEVLFWQEKKRDTEFSELSYFLWMARSPRSIDKDIEFVKEELDTLSLHKLKLLRNYLFAWHGTCSGTKSWTNYSPLSPGTFPTRT